MITPRLFRRSLRQAFQWRLLALWWGSLLVPGLIAAHPVGHFLREQLDRSTRAKDVVAWMDGSTLLDVLRQLDERGISESMAMGLAGALFTVLLVSPFMAGAMVTAARSDEPLSTGRLLAGAGEMYGRMLRTSLWAIVPLGLAGAIVAGVTKLAGRAIDRELTETAANGHVRNAFLISALIVFVFHLLVDAARAQFAADPGRRLAVLAMWSGLKLIVHRPLRALGVGFLGTFVAMGSALVLMALRLRIEQAGPFRIALAWILAQAAHTAIGWGRATRIIGLAELTRADAANRARGFRLDPPATSPPAQVPVIADVSAEPSAPLSPKDASGT